MPRLSLRSTQRNCSSKAAQGTLDDRIQYPQQPGDAGIAPRLRQGYPPHYRQNLEAYHFQVLWVYFTIDYPVSQK